MNSTTNDPILVVFVDALPFDEGARLVEQLAAPSNARVTPGVGYSINVKAELFAGLGPDDVGFFCEWNYVPKPLYGAPFTVLCRVLHGLSRSSETGSRILHKLVSRMLGKPVYAIPFDLLPYMQYSGPTAYEFSFAHETFLDRGRFKRILYSEIGNDDARVLQAAIDDVQANVTHRLFVATAQLDGVMHQHGKQSVQYRDHLALLRRQLTALVTQFQQVHQGRGRYAIFSDHGMAQVEREVRIDVEGLLGRPGPGRYGYFIDATFLRLWFDDDWLHEVMREELRAREQAGEGVILDGSQRQRFTLTDARHGDIIFMLHEGNMFCPSFFGRKLCRAMHGYEPQLDSQQGVLISNVGLGEGRTALVATDIHREIGQWLA